MGRPGRRQPASAPATAVTPAVTAPAPWREAVLPPEIYWRWRFTDAERRRVKAELLLQSERFRIATLEAEAAHQLACQAVRAHVGGDFDSAGGYAVDDTTCTVRRVVPPAGSQ
jgi:hypothetical protein